MRSLSQAISENDVLAEKLAAWQKKHGASVASAPAYTCDVCQDRGWVVPLLQALGEVNMRPVPCPAQCPAGVENERIRQAKFLENAGIHGAMKDWTFDSWAARVTADNAWNGKREAYMCARMWVYQLNPRSKEPEALNTSHRVGLLEANRLAGRPLNGTEITRHSLILQGDYGIGKTGLTIAMARALFDHQQQPLWIRWADTLDAIKNRFGKSDAPSAEDMQSMIESAAVLFVDDLNMAIDSDWRKEVATRIFRYRSRHDLPTIVTCNSTRVQLESEWGRQAMESLFEAAHYIRMGGAPIRNTDQLPEPSQDKSWEPF